MKLFILLLGVGLAVATTTSVEAAVKRPAKKSSRSVSKTKAKAPRSDLKTDVRFDESSLYGEYQSPAEALGKVENEKSMSDLLGVRKHFKDRLVESAEQE